jgi:branched-chain amino acid transport system permease protein
MIDGQPPANDRNEIYRQRHYVTQLQRARELLNDDLIEEHKRSPLGHQSDALARVAFILGNGGHAGKYAIRSLETFGRYQIITLSGERGVAPRVVDESTYSSPEEAYHAVFLRRISDMKAEQ